MWTCGSRSYSVLFYFHSLIVHRYFIYFNFVSIWVMVMQECEAESAGVFRWFLILFNAIYRLKYFIVSCHLKYKNIYIHVLHFFCLSIIWCMCYTFIGGRRTCSRYNNWSGFTYSNYWSIIGPNIHKARRASVQL